MQLGISQSRIKTWSRRRTGRLSGPFCVAVLLTWFVADSLSAQTGRLAADNLQLIQNQQPQVDQPQVPPPPPAVPAPATVPNTVQPSFLPGPYAGLFGGPPPQQRRSSRRLASAPDMFGDLSFPSEFQINGPQGFVFGGYISPTRHKIADNGSAALQNRAYFDVRTYQNAFDVTVGTVSSAQDFQRYRVGFETLLFDDWSAELRIAATGEANFNTGGVTQNTETLGNTALILKRRLFESDDLIVSGGVGINTPTGGDVEFRTQQMGSLVMRNNSVHLMPFLAFLGAPDDNWFLQGTMQVDVSAHGNRVISTVRQENISGTVDDQTLLYLDVATGFWIFHDEVPNGNAFQLTGLAPIVEFHYTSTLQDADLFLTNNALVGNGLNRIDVVNMTFGLHAEINNNTAVRVGMAVPLGDGEKRFFDSEVIFTLIRGL